MASGKYDIDIQETSLLNLAYKGFYLLQAMGQFTKDNALRDDLSVRMNTLANKLDFDNPIDVNEGIMDGLKALALNDDGEYRDNLVIKPFYEAISGYYERGIKPVSEKKEQVSNEFIKAVDSIYALEKQAKSGFYSDNDAVKSLDNVHKMLNKNANLFNIQQRKFLNEELSDLKDVADVVTFLGKHDLDKESKGVQGDMKAKGAAVPFQGQTLQDWLNNVAGYVEAGDFEQAKKAIGDIKIRDKLLAAETTARISNIKASESILTGALEPISSSKLLKDHEELSSFVSSHQNISKSFHGSKPEVFQNQKPWQTMFNQRVESLRQFANQLGYDGDVKSLIADPDELEKLKIEITGGGWMDLNVKEYGKESTNVARGVQAYVDYLRRINEEYEKMFGSPLLQVKNAVGGSGTGLPTNINIPTK